MRLRDPVGSAPKNLSTRRFYKAQTPFHKLLLSDSGTQAQAEGTITYNK